MESENYFEDKNILYLKWQKWKIKKITNKGKKRDY